MIGAPRPSRPGPAPTGSSGGTLKGMTRTVTLTASLTPEEGGYVARCVELDVTSEGDTMEEALAMLREAVALYLEDQPLPDNLAAVHPVVTSFDVTVDAA
jgi:predicted RNase H-like HicB family nuclease